MMRDESHHEVNDEDEYREDEWNPANESHQATAVESKDYPHSHFHSTSNDLTSII